MKIRDLLEETAQSIPELSYTDPGISQHLLSLNYKPSGAGGDQTTWRAPDGSILKIFGTQKGQRGRTQDHKMFEFWANYARKNALNPYMPRFSDWASFEFPQGSGQTYLQIRMETLRPVQDKTTQDILDRLEWQVKKGWDYARFAALVDLKLGPKITSTNPALDPELYTLIQKLNRIAQAQGWGLDIHSENYMLRGNQLVIVDPWVASS